MSKKSELDIEEKVDLEISENKEAHQTSKLSKAINKFKFSLNKLEDKIVYKLKNLKDKFKAYSRTKKIIIVSIPLSVIILCLIILIGYFAKADSLILPSKVSGTITDPEGNPIENVQICIENKCTTSNNVGEYTIEKLKRGNSLITLQVKDFKEVEEKLKLQYGENNFNFELIYDSFGNIYGSFKPIDGHVIDPKDFDIIIEGYEDEVISNLSTDGTFSGKRIPYGVQKIRLSSPIYKDYLIEIDISSFETNVGELELIHALDYNINVADWLTNKKLANAEIMFENQKISTNEEGFAIIKDVILNTQNTISITLSNYNPNSIVLTPTTVQPENILDAKMVNEGKVYFVSNRTGNKNIFSSNLDGTNVKLLTDNKGDNYSPYLDQKQKNIFYFSTKDQVKDNNGYIVPQVYVMDTEGKNNRKISVSNYENSNGIGEYNFESQKRIFNNYDYNIPSIHVGDLSGKSDYKLIQKNEGPGYFGSKIISNDGKTVIFDWRDYYNNDKSGVFYVASDNGDTMKKIKNIEGAKSFYLLEFSPDNSKFLYETNGDENDLWVYTIASGKDQRLTNTTSDETFSSFINNGEKIIFGNIRDGKTNLYMINSDGTNETILTNTGEVEYAWSISRDLVYFIKKSELYVLNINNPSIHQLISKEISSSEYYYFYN